MELELTVGVHVVAFSIESVFPSPAYWEARTNSVAMSTLTAQLMISKYQIPWKATTVYWLIPGMGQETYQLSQGNSVIPESQARVQEDTYKLSHGLRRYSWMTAVTGHHYTILLLQTYKSFHYKKLKTNKQTITLGLQPHWRKRHITFRAATDSIETMKAKQ